MKKILSHMQGYSLIEVLVAIAILMMSIVGPLTIAAKSIQTAQYARQQTTAFFLAQEGITAIEGVRNRRPLQAGVPNTWVDFSNPDSITPVNARLTPCFETNGCDIVLNTGGNSHIVTACGDPGVVPNPCTLKLRSLNTSAILYNHSTGADTAYTRTINLERSPANLGGEVLVTVTVEWPTRLLGGSTQNVTLRTSLFNIYDNF